VTEPQDLPNAGYKLTWPPENIVSGQPTDSKQGDIYAMGVTAYRILSGDKTFFSAMPSQDNLNHAIRTGRFPDRDKWLPHLHDPLRRVLKKAMQKDPRRRYSSASELRYALEGCIPAVSWQYLLTAGRATWTARKDGRTWTGTLTPTAGQLFSFELAAGRSISETRRRTADTIRDVPFTVAAEHARVVLGRIATKGK
jgi:serine/threonine protein kinase